MVNGCGRLTAAGTMLMVLLASQEAVAQTGGSSRFVSAVYAELLGSAGVISVNAEHQRPTGTIYRAGVGRWTAEDLFSGNEVSVVAFPLTVSRTRGAGSHRFEWGGGITLGRRSETFGSEGTFATLTGVAGYRYQQPGGGFLFRATFTPLFGFAGGDSSYPDDGVTPSIGLSFGYSWPR